MLNLLSPDPPLPRRITEPLKLALAIAIIYLIAFYMDWGKPYWATVSAVAVNLLSTGLTIHRGLTRVAGTIVGAFIGLAIVGMFPQDRWLYLVAVSLVYGFFGYMSTGRINPYFWIIVWITCGVIMAVVQSYDYTDSGEAFDVAMLRITQTLMGSLIMVVIMVFVFPYRTVDEFEDLARKLWETRRKLYKSYRGMLFGEEAAEETKHLRIEDAPLLSYAHFKLHGAQQDTLEMLEIGHDWHHYLELMAAHYEVLESLRQSLTETRDLELTKYLPNLEAVCAELDRRFEQTERMLNKNAPTEIPYHVTVSLDETETRALPHFQEAAVRVIKRQLEKLEEVSLSAFDCIAKIRMFDRPAGAHDDHHGHGHGGRRFSIDPFRLRPTLAFVAAVWVAWFVWLYVYDIPRGALYTCFVAITAGIILYRPEMNPVHYGVSWIAGGLVAGVFYTLIMHHLSGPLEFSIMVMIVVFVMQYALYPHVHPVPRIFATCGFTILLDAELHQYYSFQHYLQGLLWMGAALATTLAVRFVIVPRRPDVMFMKVLDGFFRHANFLLSAHDAEGKPDRSLARRLRSVFYGHSLLNDAEKLALFAGQVDNPTGRLTYRMLRGATPEQVQELVRCVYALAHRIEALVAAREAWRSDLVDKHFVEEKREWDEVIYEWFRRRPGTAQITGPVADLAARQAGLESRIDEAFARIDEGEMSTEDYENFYQRLGNYRGLSEAVVDYVRVAAGFDWPRWRETQF